jgi:hypothetical protein
MTYKQCDQWCKFLKLFFKMKVEDNFKYRFSKIDQPHSHIYHNDNRFFYSDYSTIMIFPY